MNSFMAFLVLLPLVWAQTTTVQQCVINSNAATLPLNTYVLGCDAPPCLIPQLQDIEIEIVFRSRGKYFRSKSEIKGNIQKYSKESRDVVAVYAFETARQIRLMRTEAHAYIFGPIGVNYDLGAESVTCNFFTNSYCPLLNGEVVQYRLRMFIESFMFVGTAVTVEFVIRDVEASSVVMCIRLPIRIVEPINQLTQQTNATVQLTMGTNSIVQVVQLNNTAVEAH